MHCVTLPIILLKVHVHAHTHSLSHSHTHTHTHSGNEVLEMSEKNMAGYIYTLSSNVHTYIPMSVQSLFVQLMYI